jgi:hypothetical protein
MLYKVLINNRFCSYVSLIFIAGFPVEVGF